MEKVDLSNQHGVAIGDYDRCRRINGTACAECKALAAKYMRDRKKDNPNLYKEQKRRYYEKHPHKKTEWNRRKERKKRARGKGLTSVNFSTKDVIDLWGTDCHICNTGIDMRITRNCGESGWEDGLHLDHVIPLAKGGNNVISNVKPSHAKCNIKKSAN
jgi:5-methylcytosine-specific restriction endonuclease McrA